MASCEVNTYTLDDTLAKLVVGHDGEQAATPAVNKIDLCKQFLGPEGAQTLADALTRASALQDASPLASARSVLLGADEIGPEGAMAIAAMLHHNKTLRTVFLGCNDIGPRGASALADALAHNTTVEALWLKRNSIGPEGAESLARVLASGNDSLRLLDLVSNKIGFEGAQHLARLLRDERCKLEVLFLGGNMIGPAGAALIADSLVHNCVLKELYLDVNDIGDEGAAAFARVLATNSTLRVLTLASNDIGDDGARILAEALSSNPLSCLQMLNLGYQKSTAVMGGQPNRIGDEGVAALARMLYSNTTLVTLNLNKNNVTHEGARALGRALNANRSLRVLELRANYAIGDDGVVGLLDALTVEGRNDTLAVLDFVGCGLGVVGLQRLARHVESHPGMLNVHLGGWRQRRADVASGEEAVEAARRIQKQLKHNRESATEPFDDVHGRHDPGDARIETWLDDIRSIYRVPKRESDDADVDVRLQQLKQRGDKKVKNKTKKYKKKKKARVDGTRARGGSGPDAADASAATTAKPSGSGLKLSVASCMRTRLLNQMRHNRDLAARLTVEGDSKEVEVDRNDSSGCSLLAVERRSESEAFAWVQDLSVDRLRSALHQEMIQGKSLEDRLLHRQAGSVITGL